MAVRADGQFYVDLGCGDGGMLQLLHAADLSAVGYDFQPTNIAGWRERGVYALHLDFVKRWDDVVTADVYIITEVLEHLTDPHGMVAKIRARGAKIVCSSPYTETYESHDACHAWAWDQAGYAKMITDAGFTVIEHQTVNQFQVLRAEG
jgi:trans-aconitate methyltransferase